jgi:type I site-specific restriction endonuclease
MPAPEPDELEWQTRRARIDTRLEALGWKVARFDPARASDSYRQNAITEYPTNNGPADYALAADGLILGMVEAKKLSLGPQNVLTQAERYSRGATGNGFDYAGFGVPFLYSTNGEVTWFHDIRHPLSRSRRVADFHTPNALRELVGRDFDAACQWFAANPNIHPRLRPYQADANAAVEQAIAARKRQMLVAMATGTGKTFTTVNQTYRMMKSGLGRRTGVDIPDLEFIVFLRPVKSRILWEQMLGRGTRKGEKYTDKSHFTVFDCFDGSLLAYFKNASAFTTDPPEKPSRTIQEVVEDIWQNRDRTYNVRCLVKRLQRINKEMSGEAREQFARFIPDGDIAQFALGLPA